MNIITISIILYCELYMDNLPKIIKKCTTHCLAFYDDQRKETYVDNLWKFNLFADENDV